METFLRQIKYWLGILSVIALFVYGHSTWAFIIIICFVIYHYDFTNKVWKEELSWLSTVILEESELKRIREHREYYDFINQLIKYDFIKKGMTISEIKNNIESYATKFQKKEYFKKFPGNWRTWVFFDDHNKKDDVVKLIGYGLDVPTPRLDLIIKAGKLVDWHEKTLTDK